VVRDEEVFSVSFPDGLVLERMFAIRETSVNDARDSRAIWMTGFQPEADAQRLEVYASSASLPGQLVSVP
jgi:hypothetical protein